MGVYEDEEVRYGFREGENWGEKGPGVRVCVEDEYEEGGRGTCGLVRREPKAGRRLPVCTLFPLPLVMI